METNIIIKESGNKGFLWKRKTIDVLDILLYPEYTWGIDDAPKRFTGIGFSLIIKNEFENTVNFTDWIERFPDRYEISKDRYTTDIEFDTPDGNRVMMFHGVFPCGVDFHKNEEIARIDLVFDWYDKNVDLETEYVFRKLLKAESAVKALGEELKCGNVPVFNPDFKYED